MPKNKNKNKKGKEKNNPTTSPSVIVEDGSLRKILAALNAISSGQEMVDGKMPSKIPNNSLLVFDIIKKSILSQVINLDERTYDILYPSFKITDRIFAYDEKEKKWKITNAKDQKKFSLKQILLEVITLPKDENYTQIQERLESLEICCQNTVDNFLVLLRVAQLRKEVVLIEEML